MALACYQSSVQSREVGRLKKHLVLSVLLLVSLLTLLPVISGCGVATQQTTATLGETEAGSAADAAIAAVTKSDDIESPATIEAGVLLAGSDTAAPPLAYLAIVERVKDNEVVKEVAPVGFEVDLCTAIAEKMGLELRVVSTAWADLIPTLESGQVDILMSGMATSRDLREQLSATDPHLAADLAISTPVAKPIDGEAELASKIVGVQIDTVAQTALDGVGGVKEIRPYPRILDAFRDLAAGRLDAVVADEPASLWILENNADYKGKYAVTGALETGEGYAYWCTKDKSALLGAMNTALEQLRNEGVYDKICAKWGLTGD